MYRIVTGVELILASSSPRRRALLAECGLVLPVSAPDCDETIVAQERPEKMVERLALLKADTLAAKYREAWLIGADTTVAIDGIILGKPADYAEAVRMLTMLQGRQHEVYGGIALVNLASQIADHAVYRSVVRMRAMDRPMIDAYVSTAEPMDKAGAYAIQGIGASLIDGVQGSYTNVVGLNLCGLLTMLLDRGVIEIAGN